MTDEPKRSIYQSASKALPGELVLRVLQRNPTRRILTHLGYMTANNTPDRRFSFKLTVFEGRLCSLLGRNYPSLSKNDLVKMALHVGLLELTKQTSTQLVDIATVSVGHLNDNAIDTHYQSIDDNESREQE